MTAAATPNDPRAVATAVACYSLWGLLPLLFMALAAHGFGAPEILAHRAVWSVFVAGLFLLLAGQWGEAKQVLATPRTLAWLALSAAMIATTGACTSSPPPIMRRWRPASATTSTRC